MPEITILEIDGRPGTDAKVTFTSGNSTVPQTLFSPWDEINTLEPGATYPLSFGTKVEQAETGTPAETAAAPTEAAPEGEQPTGQPTAETEAETEQQ